MPVEKTPGSAGENLPCQFEVKTSNIEDGKQVAEGMTESLSKKAQEIISLVSSEPKDLSSKSITISGPTQLSPIESDLQSGEKASIQQMVSSAKQQANLGTVEASATIDASKTLSRFLVLKFLKRKEQKEMPLRLEMAKEVAAEINGRAVSGQSITVSPYIREPLTNLRKQEGLEKAEEKFARLIPYERFVSSLRTSFMSTLSGIISESTPPPSYVIIADDGDKSTNWVVSQTLDIMKTHPPQAIVPREALSKYLKEHPLVKHIIMMDDGSYSGSQVEDYLGSLYSLRGVLTHVCIPYMTKVAKEVILKIAKMKRFPIEFSPHHIMLSYEEMSGLGYFGYQKMVRPDVRRLLEIKPISEGSPEELRTKVDKVNSDLQKIQKDVFKKPDEQLNLELDALISYLSNECSHEVFSDLTEVLTRVKEGVQRFGVDSGVAQKNFSSRSALKEGTRTPVWMAHKSADGVSTYSRAMRVATGGIEAIPPYKNTDKENKGRRDLVDELRIQERSSATEGVALDDQYSSNRMGKEEIVLSNRGCFLIADNYCSQPTDDRDQLVLCVDGKEFLLGGTKGLFQYQLKEGMTFTVKNELESKTFKYEGGRIDLFQKVDLTKEVGF